MVHRIDTRSATRSCALLGIKRIARDQRKPHPARDEAAYFLSKNIRVLATLGKRPKVTLEDLQAAKLLPSRIGNIVDNARGFGPKETDAYLFNDTADICEQDFEYFSHSRNVGERSTLVLRSIQNIYFETGRFQNLPGSNPGAAKDIGIPEQEALIERVAKCVRNDPGARKTLLRMFPPQSAKP